jgi:hypothetical protein
MAYFPTNLPASLRSSLGGAGAPRTQFSQFGAYDPTQPAPLALPIAPLAPMEADRSFMTPPGALPPASPMAPPPMPAAPDVPQAGDNLFDTDNFHIPAGDRLGAPAPMVAAKPMDGIRAGIYQGLQQLGADQGNPQLASVGLPGTPGFPGAPEPMAADAPQGGPRPLPDLSFQQMPSADELLAEWRRRFEQFARGGQQPRGPMGGGAMGGGQMGGGLMNRFFGR